MIVIGNIPSYLEVRHEIDNGSSETMQSATVSHKNISETPFSHS